MKLRQRKDRHSHAHQVSLTRPPHRVDLPADLASAISRRRRRPTRPARSSSPRRPPPARWPRRVRRRLTGPYSDVTRLGAQGRSPQSFTRTCGPWRDVPLFTDRCSSTKQASVSSDSLATDSPPRPAVGASVRCAVTPCQEGRQSSASADPSRDGAGPQHLQASARRSFCLRGTRSRLFYRSR